MPLHSALCATARRISEESAAVAITHDWSGEIDADFARIFKVMTGFAANPNIFATIFLTLGTPGELEIIDKSKSIGLSNSTIVNVSEIGSMELLYEIALNEAISYLALADQVARVSVPWSSLHLGLECGGSDALSGITANPALGVASDMLVELGAVSVLGETTEILGAEHLLAARA